MKELEFPFVRDRFKHELVERQGLVCLVKRSKPGHWHWEVVKLQIMPPSQFKGQSYPEREKYPGDEQWGTYGFTYLPTDLEIARKRYLSLKEGAFEPPVG